MLPIPKKLLKQGVRDMVRISDARMSGTTYGACILHVSPESYVGGPLALVRTGDIITLDVPARTIDLDVPEAELARRRAELEAAGAALRARLRLDVLAPRQTGRPGLRLRFPARPISARRSASRRFTNPRRSGARSEPGTSRFRVRCFVPPRNDRRNERMSKLSDTTRSKLKTVTTATVATALFKRGLRIQCIQDVHPLSPEQPTMVGEAFTLRYMPAREDLNPIDVFRDRAHPQRKAVEDCPPGAVLRDRQPQGCPRGVRRRHPGDAADEARRRRRRHRRRLPRLRRRSRDSAFPPTTSARARRPT